MTKMLQKTENVAKNVADENSQDLTEQWKKGHLEGFRWYYVKFKTGEIDICWLTEWSNDELGTGGQYFDGIKEENIIEVLAPVPSYEEWKASYNCMLENEVLRLKNAQLKELLEECKTPLEVYNEMFGNKEELLTKIDEVLK